MGIYKKSIEALNGMIGKDKRFDNPSVLAERVGTAPSFVHRHLKGERGKNLQPFLEMLDKLGFKLLLPEERPADQSREVCFVDAKIVSAGEGVPSPKAENYIAVPMVGEVGAGPGIIPQEDVRSWILVYREHASVSRRSNMLAVEIGKNQRSMMPTLFPNDIVLVDRDDWGAAGYNPPGNIYLVREPGQEGGGMVKRVSASGKGELATITFYSDNPEYGPETYHMHQYDFDYRRAIVGKVVWAWSDLGKK